VLPVPSAAPAPLGPGPALQRRLAELEVFVDAEPGRPMVVPAEVRRVLVDLKDALLDSAERLLPGALERPDSEAALEDALSGQGYTALDVSLRAPSGHRERWGVTLCVVVSPGSDCLLAVYERRNDALRRALVVRSDLYDTIEGALHGLTWAASPPDGSGRYYVLEAHTHPWPSSRFRKLEYRALAPGADSGEPIVLASAKASGIWENGFRLEASAERFSVEFDVHTEAGPDFVKPERHTWVRRSGTFTRSK